MQHCWMCRQDFADDVRMVVPPREASHICVACSETPRGRQMMARESTIADGYYPGSHVRGDRQRQALRKALGLPKLRYRDDPTVNGMKPKPS